MAFLGLPSAQRPNSNHYKLSNYFNKLGWDSHRAKPFHMAHQISKLNGSHREMILKDMQTQWNEQQQRQFNPIISTKFKQFIFRLRVSVFVHTLQCSVHNFRLLHMVNLSLVLTHTHVQQHSILVFVAPPLPPFFSPNHLNWHTIYTNMIRLIC